MSLPHISHVHRVTDTQTLCLRTLLLSSPWQAFNEIFHASSNSIRISKHGTVTSLKTRSPYICPVGFSSVHHSDTVLVSCGGFTLGEELTVLERVAWQLYRFRKEHKEQGIPYMLYRLS